MSRQGVRSRSVEISSLDEGDVLVFTPMGIGILMLLPVLMSNCRWLRGCDVLEDVQKLMLL
jgi:hypothetical protein